MLKLAGIVVVAVGFAFRLNALVVVLAAALTSGLAAGMSVREVVARLGSLFADNRALVLPLILMMPVVGIVERYGLKEHIAGIMRRSGASAGRVLWLYQVIRGATSMVGLGIGNHASMVRPLVVPMAERGVRDPKIRAHAAAAENVGNFFSDDILVAVGALLLIDGFLDSIGVPVELADLQLWSIPTALWVILIGAWRFRRLGR